MSAHVKESKVMRCSVVMMSYDAGVLSLYVLWLVDSRRTGDTVVLAAEAEVACNTMSYSHVCNLTPA